MTYSFAVGSGCKEDQPGIYLYELDPDAGSIRCSASVSGIADSTWLEADYERNLIYTGGTIGGKGVVAVYLFEPSHSHLSLLKTIPVPGGASCHQSLDPQREFLCVSFYETGSLSLIRLDKYGFPREETCHIQHSGHSAHPRRQREAHVHFSGFIGNFLYVCDLGEDRIYEYRLDRKTGHLTDTGKKIRTLPGDGPRHFVYAPSHDLLYVVTEMGGNVSVFSRKSGNLLQRINSIPANVDRGSLPVIDYDAFGAAIHWCGPDHILVSNRGHDSITIFEVQSNGLLERIFTGSIHGRIPRDFGILKSRELILPKKNGSSIPDNSPRESNKKEETYIVSSNQTSNDLTIMKLAADGRSFSDTGIRSSIPSPTRILPL